MSKAISHISVSLRFSREAMFKPYICLARKWRQHNYLTSLLSFSFFLEVIDLDFMTSWLKNYGTWYSDKFLENIHAGKSSLKLHGCRLPIHTCDAAFVSRSPALYIIFTAAIRPQRCSISHTGTVLCASTESSTMSFQFTPSVTHFITMLCVTVIFFEIHWMNRRRNLCPLILR